MRGDLKLNRTLHESPATASLHSVTPKRKNVPYSFDFRGGGFFLKWKGHFSFWGSALQVFGQCGGAKCGTRFCENYFLGVWIFAKPRLICFWILSARRRGLGRNPRGLFWGELFFPVLMNTFMILDNPPWRSCPCFGKYAIMRTRDGKL